MKRIEETTNTVPSRKGKTYYPILKTKSEVEIFLENFEKCKAAFPKLVEQVNIKALHATSEDMNEFVDILLDEIGKLGGTVRSSLSYAKNHSDDGQSLLAHDSNTLEALKQAAKDIRDFEKGVEFAIAQSQTMSVFHALAKGIIPTNSFPSPTMEALEEN
ncbi:MAG: hypothetical protein LUK37_03650 [Clostridia bacterium]|nr:hypothetical protein [Clostridia bacterium]